MVIGSGLIANGFLNAYGEDKDVVIFASGVSNSNETRASEFERERHLLSSTLDNYPRALFIYFSTYSIDDPDAQYRPYVLHKKEMESLVERHPGYLILRASNVVGNQGNPNTIINFFVDKIISNQRISIWNATMRNLIDIDDLYKITRGIVEAGIKNKTLIVANPNSIYASEIATIIAQYKNKTAHIELIEKGSHFGVQPSREVLEIIERLHLNFDDDYFMRLLKKYY